MNTLSRSAGTAACFMFLLVIVLPTPAHAYRVMVMLNGYRPKLHPNAVAATRLFRCDGCDLMPQNFHGEFTPDHWKVMIRNCGNWVTTSAHWNDPSPYNYVLQLINRQPNDTMIYMESRRPDVQLPPHTKYNEPGGMVLKPQQIREYSAAQGGMPIVVCTGGYQGGWKTAVDRALRDPSVAGVQMEFVNDYKKSAACVDAIKAIHAAGKRAYLYMFGGTPVHETEEIVDYLRKRIPREMDSPNTILMVVNYGDKDRGVASQWFSPYDCSVVANIAKLKTLPGYHGQKRKRDNGPLPERPKKVSTTTLLLGARWVSDDWTATVVARKRNEVVVLVDSGGGFKCYYGGEFSGHNGHLTCGGRSLRVELKNGNLTMQFSEKSGNAYTIRFRPEK